MKTLPVTSSNSFSGLRPSGKLVAVAKLAVGDPNGLAEQPDLLEIDAQRRRIAKLDALDS